MMEASGYTLDLYCDNKQENWPEGRHAFRQFPEQFVGERRGECVRQAQRRGWVFKRDKTHVCPKCSGKP